MIFSVKRTMIRHISIPTLGTRYKFWSRTKDMNYKAKVWSNSLKWGRIVIVTFSAIKQM